jgi:DNA-binding NarL/FixJ family response regulator
VLIVDDHQPFRVVARHALAAAGFDVVGEAGTGEEAVANVARLRPQLVLLDVNLPDLDGFAVACLLADLAVVPAIVFMSVRDGAAQRARIAATPALGFLAKSEFSAAALTELLG